TAATLSDSGKVDAPKSGGKGSMMAYFGAFLATTIILGLFLAKDVSHLLGQGAIDLVYNDDLEGVHDPDYDEADQLWANGKHLEAIQAFRDYLKMNPRKIHVATRIAEIYEKDLRNYLAAILEYEEILKPDPKF